MTIQEYEERVHDFVNEGVLALNQAQLAKELYKVDVNEINQSDYDKCVLTLGLGDFAFGLNEMGIKYSDAYKYGFCLPDELTKFVNSDNIELFNEANKILNNEWKACIDASKAIHSLGGK